MDILKIKFGININNNKLLKPYENRRKKFKKLIATLKLCNIQFQTTGYRTSFSEINKYLSIKPQIPRYRYHNQSWHFYSGFLLGFFRGGTDGHLWVLLSVLPVPLVM
jgi:hypothetical protein